MRIPATVGTSDKPYSLSLEEWLDEQEGFVDLDDKALRALRAVVELHRMVLAGLPDHYWCEHCRRDWPCPTIVVIEEVL